MISATNSDLAEQVKAGRFREDLYYRLNVIPITLPPLKDRSGDIALLARYFLGKICKEMHRPLMTLSPEALRDIEAYDWPGNVREMENVIERTVALTDDGTIASSDLPPDISSSNRDITNTAPLVSSEGVDMNQVIAEIERQMIQQALVLENGVKARAADLLNINRTTLVEKIKRLGLQL